MITDALITWFHDFIKALLFTLMPQFDFGRFLGNYPSVVTSYVSEIRQSNVNFFLPLDETLWCLGMTARVFTAMLIAKLAKFVLSCVPTISASG